MIGVDIMAEEINMKEVIEEVKNANEDGLKQVIENWFEKTRTQSMKIGAQFISAAIFGVIQKHIKKASPSLRDYKRMTDEIIKIISIQLTTQQNDLEESVIKENENDGTTESNDNTNS